MINANAIRLRACRRRGGLDQADLAHLLGISRHAVSRLERGLATPSAELLIRYELIFEVPAANVLPDTRILLSRQVHARALQALERCRTSRSEAIRQKAIFLQTICGRLEKPQV
jgi:transcriptional regulator with XRE-family HTH domain